MNVKKVLGGILYDAINHVGNNTFVARKKVQRFLAAAPQWVIKDFLPDDFVGIYFIEGLAYQYWRLLALLRSLEKALQLNLPLTENGITILVLSLTP